MESCFINWCRETVGYIRFKPDRDKVCHELMQHLADKQRQLEAAGLTKEAAMERAIVEMGEAETVGRALDKVHNTPLNWLWKLSRILLLFAVLWLGIGGLCNGEVVGAFAQQLKILWQEPYFQGMHPLLDPERSCIGHQIPLHEMEIYDFASRTESMEGKSFLCYGIPTETEAGAYRFQLPYACWWQGEEGEQWVSLALVVRGTGLLPPSPPAVFRNGLYLEDDRGHRYTEYQVMDLKSGRWLRGEYLYALTLAVDGEAERLTLCYDKGDFDWKLLLEKEETA